MIALASAVILRFSFMAEAIKIDKRGWRKVQSVFPTARSYDFSQLRRGTGKREKGLVSERRFHVAFPAKNIFGGKIEYTTYPLCSLYV